jgi:hypothetical protein
MLEKNYIKIQLQHEVQFINLDQVVYISIVETSISFHLTGNRSISFTKTQLGEEEYAALKNSLNPTPGVRPLH